MGEFRMPSLGADMDAGTLARWRVAPGDAVKRGDVVAEVETDKGVVEVEIWLSGVIEQLAVSPGAKVPVGTVLATVRTNGAPSRVPAASEASAAKPVSEGRVLASPAARQLARELDVDVASLHGTGPHGAVTRSDVARASLPSKAQAPSQPPAPAPAPAPAEPRPPSVDVSAMRRAMAAAMTRSKREIPHYYLSADLDASRAIEWLERENAGRGAPERILFAVLLLKASALAARAVPELNGFFVDGAVQPCAAVHLGVAISLRQGGLIAPAIHDVDTKSLPDIQASLRDLVARARSGRLRSSELSDATLTVTNLGEQGVDSVFGVIYPPQVALVGFGKVAERAWASGGMVGARPVVTSTLSGDHRVSDGHRGAAFLATVGRLLQEPEKL
jgi:pyruvate dehydrogenase E2 component (dihydrolipoamide acetyltransferase)